PPARSPSARARTDRLRALCPTPVEKPSFHSVAAGSKARNRVGRLQVYCSLRVVFLAIGSFSFSKRSKGAYQERPASSPKTHIVSNAAVRDTARPGINRRTAQRRIGGAT